jgi:hypothetical protein
MNSKYWVKEDLRPVPFAHGGVALRVKLPVNWVKPAAKFERGAAMRSPWVAVWQRRSRWDPG